MMARAIGIGLALFLDFARWRDFAAPILLGFEHMARYAAPVSRTLTSLDGVDCRSNGRDARAASA